MNRFQFSISLEERDVAWRYVQQKNPQDFKRGQNLFDHRPARFELLTFLRLPVRPNIRREIGTDVQISSGKVQNERAFYDRHLDDLQFITKAKELRHVESKNGADFPLSKALVNAFFPQVKFEKPMRLNRHFRWVNLAFA